MTLIQNEHCVQVSVECLVSFSYYQGCRDANLIFFFKMTKGQVIIVQSTIKFFVAINDSFIRVKIMLRSNMFIKTLLYRFQISLNTSQVHVVPLQNYHHHIRKKIRTSCLSFFVKLR